MLKYVLTYGLVVTGKHSMPSRVHRYFAATPETKNKVGPKPYLVWVDEL